MVADVVQCTGLLEEMRSPRDDGEPFDAREHAKRLLVRSSTTGSSPPTINNVGARTPVKAAPAARQGVERVESTRPMVFCMAPRPAPGDATT